MSEPRRILVTGGAGFIGSEVVRQLVAQESVEVLNLDSLTYAGNLASLQAVEGKNNYRFVHGDIRDTGLLAQLFDEFRPTGVMHLAAESHVDRSIDGPAEFLQTNIIGTFDLLEQAVRYRDSASADIRDAFRFHHVSTDEVFGSLGAEGAFTESTPYSPRSPYSASKASSDHLVRAWHETYGLPVVITNCSNNYGPFQFPEKLIPVVIRKAIAGEPIPVYGNGENVRDWLYVGDHAEALQRVFERGRVGETYNIGGNAERRNIDVVQAICTILDELSPQTSPDGGHASLIEFVDDRPGHDFRYAIDASKLRNELGWQPRETFDSGMRRTVGWYLDNGKWIDTVLQDKYDGERLGLQRSST